MNFKLKAFYFIQFLSFGILGPYLALYLTQKGFTGTQVGLLLGMVPLLTVLIQPVWSALSDILHKRRPLLIIACLGVSGTYFVVFPFRHFHRAHNIHRHSHCPGIPKQDRKTG